MKKFLALALTLTLALALSISSFAFTIGNPNGVETFDPKDAPTNVSVNVTVGNINHRYAVDITYADINLSISGNNLTWNPTTLEYDTNGASGLADAESTVKIENYSDLPIYVEANIDDKDPNDGIKVTTDLADKTSIEKATAASEKGKGDGSATSKEIKISVTTDGKTWAEVADYYTPKLTGGTSTLPAAIVKITVTMN